MRYSTGSILTHVARNGVPEKGDNLKFWAKCYGEPEVEVGDIIIIHIGVWKENEEIADVMVEEWQVTGMRPAHDTVSRKAPYSHETIVYFERI